MTKPSSSFLLPSFSFLRSSSFYALLAFVVTLAIYMRTLLPGAVGGDAGELQYAGPLLALIHPTGQPLYGLLGFLWSKVMPFGSVAWRMNLLAAVCGAATCAVVAWMLHRLFGRPLIALAGGLTLGLGATLWSQAVIADKYAFSAFFAALVTGLALYWIKVRGQPTGNRWLYALSLAYGLSLLHHRSMFMFAPALGITVLLLERSAIWRNCRRTLLCLALVLLPPLIVYPLALPWMESHHLTPLMSQPSSLSEWIGWWVEQQYLGDTVIFDSFANVSARLAMYGQTLLADYGILVPLVAGLGLLALGRRSPGSLAFILISYILVGGMAANYRGNERQFTYYLPSFVVLIFAYAEGLNALWQAAARRQVPKYWQPTAMGIVVLLAGAVPVLQLRYAYPLRRLDATYGEPLDIWRQTLKTGNMGERLASGMETLPPNATVIGDWEQITTLWYYQHVEGRRPDLQLVYPVERLADLASSGREICVTRNLPVGKEWHPTNVGGLVWLQRQPAMVIPEQITPVGTALYTPDDQPILELAGYQAESDVYPAGHYAPLLLTWRALNNIPDDYSLSLHVLTEDWQQVWSQDIAAPVLGMYPTSRWVQGEVVQDYHELPIPREMPPARYLWTVVIYRKLADGTFAQLHDQSGNLEILGGTFEVTPPQP